LTHRIRANASNPAGAAITAAILAFGIMGMVEVVDGFTGKHRFSREDIIANAAGAAFSAIRNTVPGLHDKLDFRLMYTPASFERRGLSNSKFSFIPPYNRQRYIFALKASGFDVFRNTPMRYLELHAGFEARGFSQREKALGYPIERRLYVGIGLNLNEVLFGNSAYPNFSRYKDSLAGRITSRTLEYVQLPYTAIYYRSRPSGLRP